MKTKLQFMLGLIVVLSVALKTNAQDLFPNSGFENWHTSNCQEPDNWNTFNYLIYFIGCNTTPGIDAHSGSTAIRLETIDLQSLGPAPGFATSGTINTQQQNPDGGIAFTDRPDSINGWYKYLPAGSDNAMVAAYLFGANRDTIGKAEFIITDSATNYTYFSAPFIYLSGLAPDTAIAIITSSRLTGEVGSVLYIDDLNHITGPIGLIINNIHNSTCNGNDGSISVAATGTGPFTYQWNSNPIQYTNVLSGVGAGNYTVTIADGLGNHVTHTFNIGGPSNPTGTDLAGNFVATNFRPVLPSHIFLDIANQGCVAQNGSAQLTLDSLLTYISATPPPDAVLGNTLFWNFPSLTSDSAHFTSVVDVYTDTLTPFGIFACLTLDVFPSEQDNNNHIYMCYPVFSSFDPNNKQVYPQGQGEEGFINANKKMSYTVHFQNTGNAEAFDIYILDTLDSDLNIQSLHITGSSHAMTTEILPGNVLKFLFADIHLPDSTSDEPNSHGYLMYEIDQNPNLPDWTELKNTAYIYFDYNPPVVTNTVKNTIGIPAAVITIEQYPFIIYPNPATTNLIIEQATDGRPTTTSLYDITGKLLQTRTVNQTKFNLDVSGLSKGIYILSMFDGEKQVNKKIIKE